MCDLAVRGALALGCSAPCAVEFILDSGNNFYFAGMGSRTQAEHSITEMTSGIDLVQEQIRLAAGEPLRFAQEDIRLRGHALGCRYEIENSKHFAPDRGVIRPFIGA
jgi:acetyl-CoA carboxylase biotin carboxylase subunit